MDRWKDGGYTCSHSVLVKPFTDPNNLYPWQTEPPGPKDKLDFRHHSYEEMRKVRQALELRHFSGPGKPPSSGLRGAPK